jgi:hypothetical protein
MSSTHTRLEGPEDISREPIFMHRYNSRTSARGVHKYRKYGITTPELYRLAKRASWPFRKITTFELQHNMAYCYVRYYLKLKF